MIPRVPVTKVAVGVMNHERGYMIRPTPPCLNPNPGKQSFIAARFNLLTSTVSKEVRSCVTFEMRYVSIVRQDF